MSNDSLTNVTNYSAILDPEYLNCVTVERICVMIKAFADKLPASIDPLNKLFVPANLLNAIPKDRAEYGAFRYEEESLFERLRSWSDTRKSAYGIQLCYLLQQLLINPTKSYNITESLEQSIITGLSHKDSEKLKTGLRLLPYHRDCILNAKTMEDRNKVLNEAYEEISKNYDRFTPSADLEMYYHFQSLKFKPYKWPSNCANIEEEKINRQLLK